MPGSGHSAGGTAAGRLATLAAAVDAVVAVDVDGLDEPAVRAELDALETHSRQLAARSTRLARALSSRQARRCADRDGGRAGQRAERDIRQELTDKLRWTPTRAARTLRTGRRLAGAQRAQAAFDAGRLDADQARVIADTLLHLVDEAHDDVERALVDAARSQNAVELGKTARGLLAQVDPKAALDDADRRHARRWARVAANSDGMLAIHGELAGVDAEAAATAIEAFRVPDAPTEHRTPAQATADALAAALRAGLDVGQAPTCHGVRPHVTISLTWQDLAAAAGYDVDNTDGAQDATGVARLPHLGPVPIRQIRRLLDDAAITRIVTGPDSQPLDVGRSTRTIPTGIWKALVARDGGCTWPGCDAPAAWCDAAHVGIRWGRGGTVATDQLALLCRRHHRQVDRNEWTGRLDAGRVVWTPPRRPDPATGPDPP